MNDPGTEFIKKTRYPDFSTVDMILRIPEPPQGIPVPEGAKVIKLPSPKRIKVNSVAIRDALEQWEPEGFFSRSSITLKELSFCSGVYREFEKLKGMLRSPAMSPQVVSGIRSRPTL